MKTNQNNKNLFWHGVYAKLKIFFGSVLFIIGLIVLMFQTIIAIIIIIFAIILIVIGKQQRFDYKMQSGTMIHKGDW